jgi:hypothetical protein
VAKANNVSTISNSCFHNVSNEALVVPAHLLCLARTCVQQLLYWRKALTPNTWRTTPDPKAWRVTRDGDVILPNRKIELRARSSGMRAVAVA